MSATNKDVAHSWAHQHSDTRAGNFRHEGPELLSYGTTIGWHFRDFVLLSPGGMTPTTNARHLSPAKYATTHLRQIGVNLFTQGRRIYTAPTPEQILSDLERQFADLLSAYPRKLNKTEALARLKTVHDNIMFIAERYDITGNGLDAFDFSPMEAEAEKSAEAEREREQKRLQNAEIFARRQREHDAEAYTAFLKGDTSRCPASHRTVEGSHSLTIRPFIYGSSLAGSEPGVITSGGARAPLKEVVLALKTYDALRENDLLPWASNGIKIPVGGYQIDRIDTDGTVHAGCHTFSAAEIDRFRKQWGL